MVKILIGLVAAIVVAAGGFFGFEFYVQHRVAGEVEAAFAQIRAQGGKASHGKVSFDLWSRTITVADIAGESTAQPPVSVKIGSFTASGVRQPDATRFSAKSIEITDFEIGLEMPHATFANITYRAPRIALTDYSGPASAPRLPASSSLTDLYRAAFEQVANMTAASVAVPTLAGTMKFTAAMQGGIGDGEFTYSGFVMEDIKQSRIASMKTREAVFKFAQPSGVTKTITASLADFAAYETDLKVMAAIFDPQKANDNQYYRVYRQISTGPFTIKFDQLVNARIEAFTVDDVAMRPSRLQYSSLMAMMPPPGAAPQTPAQAREIFEKAAGVYEGVRIGNAEMRGLSVETPQGPVKLAATRFNFEDGKIGEFAFEGLDANAPKGPVKVGRFALKSFDIANLLRMSSQFGTPGQQPTPDQLVGMLRLLAGAEVKGVVAPYKDTGSPVNIEAASLNWGQFVGPIPTSAHLIVKMSGPIDGTDADPFKVLVAAGMRSATMSVDLGAGWTEASRSFALDPVTFELGNVVAVSARLSLGNVPREVFSLNPQQAVVTAAQIEAGIVELKVRDLGGIDLAVAQYARTQNVSADDARRAIVDNIKAGGVTPNGDANAAVIAGALAAFVETPRGTLTIKLTPRAKVPAMQLVQAMKTDPLAALAQFQVDASTAR